MSDPKTIVINKFTNPEFTSACDVKAYLATGDLGMPHIGCRYLCNRMAPTFGETYSELLRRLGNCRDVPQLVSTSGVKEIVKLAGTVYLVKTIFSDYVVKVTTEMVALNSKKTFLGYSNVKPVVGENFTCSRMEDDDFTQPVTCTTSPVLQTRIVARNIWQVETQNSHYFVCVISD